MNRWKWVVGLGVLCAALGSTAEAGRIVVWGYEGRGLHDPPAGDDFVAVAGGSYHALALREDGSLAAWGGYNYDGELDVPKGNDYVAVAVGDRSSLALRSDGSIAAWGDATAPPGNDFSAITAGGYVHLALRDDGSIFNFGPGCIPPRASCFQPEGNDFVAVDRTVALRADGSVVIARPEDPPPGNDFIAVASGQGHLLMLRSDGSLAAWVPRPLPNIMLDVPEGNDFSAIAAGWGFSLALRDDGSLVGWGMNYFGETDVPAGNRFVAVDAGRWYGLAIEVPEPGMLAGCLTAAIVGLVLAARARCRRAPGTR